MPGTSSAQVAAPTTQPGGIPQSYAVPAPLVAALTRRLITGGRPELRTVVTPMTGQALYELPCSSRADVEVAIDHARGAQRAWSRLPIEHRARIIMRVHDLVLDRQVQLLDLMQLESGNSAAGLQRSPSPSWRGTTPGGGSVWPASGVGGLSVLTRAETIRQPYGVVGSSARQLPFTLPIGDAAPCSPAAPWCSARPADDVDGPVRSPVLAAPGCLTVCCGCRAGPTVGQAVVDLADYVCYRLTGSAARSLDRCARQLVPSSLELGSRTPLRAV
jgi:succinate-semialdehyde dehydrogenase/glutarate-semialdehyde dehydrogenase